MINPILSSWQYFITLHGCLHILNKSQINPDIAFFPFRLEEIVAWPKINIVMIFSANTTVYAYSFSFMTHATVLLQLWCVQLS